MEQEDLVFLKNVLPFWDKLMKSEKEHLEGRVLRLSFKKGQRVHEGGDCSGLLVVKSGRIRAYILSEEGKEITLFRLFDRDVCILSSSCMMKNINFDIQVDAEADSEILLIPASVYQSLSQANAAVKDFSAEIISSRLSDVMWVVEQVVFMSLDRRLANYLLEQSSIEGKDELPVTHEMIARNIGSAREAVTRMLRYFQNEGLVSVSRGMVTLIDKKRLMQIS